MHRTPLCILEAVGGCAKGLSSMRSRCWKNAPCAALYARAAEGELHLQEVLEVLLVAVIRLMLLALLGGRGE